MKQNQSGFTLIEIAIVLVIIGLLLGGVLKGQELINSAKVKNIATDFRNIPVFIYGYQDKYRALPGDDANAASHLGVASGVVASGNGDGVLGTATDNWSTTNATDETQLFWQHVRLAGLAAGPTSGQTDYRPNNAMGGVIGIQSGSSTAPPMKDFNGVAIRGSYIICSTGILGKFVKQLDITMDDGNTGTGSMIALKGAYTYGATATDPSTTPVDDAASYTVCMGV